MTHPETAQTGRPRVAVYGISRDEAHHIARWANSARDADLIILADTGSTDGTVTAARELGIRVEAVSVEPFRYDVARNQALALVPDDIDFCVSLDLDEVLADGWREQIDAAWRAGATRVRCQYVWPWSDRHPALRFTMADRIHARRGYLWRFAVHEGIAPTDLAAEVEVVSTLEIRHLRDTASTRPQYLHLLRTRAKEHPDDGPTAHLLASEARVGGHLEEAIRQERRALSLPLPPYERLHALLSMASLEPVAREEWLLAACLEFPERREPWCGLAQLHLERGDWRPARRTALTALAITHLPDDYLTNVFVWGHWPEQIAAVASAQLGEREQALHHARRAARLAPWDDEITRLLAESIAAVTPPSPSVRWPNRNVRRRSVPKRSRSGFRPEHRTDGGHALTIARHVPRKTTPRRPANPRRGRRIRDAV